MRKDITKKFLAKKMLSKDFLAKKMLSKDVVSFILRKKINIDIRQIDYDEIEFKNFFSAKCIISRLIKTNRVFEHGDKLQNVVKKNGKGIQFNMIYCEKGTFTMGSDDPKDESPKRVVEIKRSFWLAEIVVTQELYELVMGENPSLYKGPKYDNVKERPVDYVNFFNAIMFCNELSKLMGKIPYYEIQLDHYEHISRIFINKDSNGFRLPSSEEWEYAAKAGTNNKYAGTNDKSKLGEYAWFGEDYKTSPTHPVAQKKPNEWGFYDMTGNVWEWIWSEFTPRYYGKSGSIHYLRGGDNTTKEPNINRIQSDDQPGCVSAFYDSRSFRFSAYLDDLFSTRFIKLNRNNTFGLKNVVKKNGKTIEFNMIYCEGKKKSHREFLLGETEITQELYELVMGYNPSKFKGKSYPNSSQRPVENVTYYDAIMFCNKLSLLCDTTPYYTLKNIQYQDETKTNISYISDISVHQSGIGFRLPEKVEWEYAAKANTNNKYVGTSDDDRLEEYAWFEKNADQQTHPVATKKPNEWGFYDMSGNVWEWCIGGFFAGGSWYNNTTSPFLHSVTRDASAKTSSRFNDTGFRIAKFPIDSNA